MKRMLVLITLVLLLTGLGATPAWADSWTLWDWSVNIDGQTYNPPGLPGTVNAAGFDFGTGLGTMTIMFNTPGAHFGGIYLYPFWGSMDYSNAYAAAVGPLPAGVSFSLGWPGVDYGSGSVFDMFAANTLDDTNWVSAYSPPPSACCSVAMAGILSFDLSPGETAWLTFTTNTTAPSSGSYLQLTDADNGESYYLSESFTTSSGPTIPEPASALLVVSGIGALLRFTKRSRK